MSVPPPTSSSKQIRTRILILSDTHSALPYPAEAHQPSKDQHPFRHPLPKTDILLHAGDLTSNGSLLQHQCAIDLIAGVDADLKIVIPGNHDVTLDDAYYQKYPNAHCSWPKYDADQLQQIREMYDKGIECMVEGVREFKVKRTGAKFTVYASAYQPEFWNWAFGYPRDEDRFNLDEGGGGRKGKGKNPVPDEGVDIMLTHGPPCGILDRTIRNEDVGCEHLRRAVERCKPRLHAFGHIHEGWGGVVMDWDVDKGRGGRKRNKEKDIEMTDPEKVINDRGMFFDATRLEYGRQTLFVNASIMDVSYNPVQAPWIVDLMLPCE